MVPAKGKDQSIETLRGLALLLLVAFHADKGDGRLNEMFSLIRMPLFTAISGYLYACRPVTPNNTLNFVVGKMRRLLIPMFVFVTIWLIIHFISPKAGGRFVPDSIESYLRFYFFHPSVFWFIQAIFLVFIFMCIVEPLKLLANKWLTVVWIGAASALYVSTSMAAFEGPKWLLWFSLDGAFYLLPFFLTGLWVKRFNIESDRWIPKIAAVIGIAGFLVVVFFGEQQWHVVLTMRKMPVRDSIVSWAPDLCGFSGTFISIASMIALLSYRVTIKQLAAIGGYAYDIYLSHLIFGTVFLFYFTKLGIQHAFFGYGALHFASMMISSYVFARLLRKTEFTRRFFLGLRGSRQRRAQDGGP